MYVCLHGAQVHMSAMYVFVFSCVRTYLHIELTILLCELTEIVKYMHYMDVQNTQAQKLTRVVFTWFSCSSTFIARWICVTLAW